MVSIKLFKENKSYLGKFDVSQLNSNVIDANLKFFIIIDQSGYSANEVTKFTNNLLPKLLNNINMSNTDIRLISLLNNTNLYLGNLTIKNLNKYSNITPYVLYDNKNLENLFSQLLEQNYKKNVKVLTISNNYLCCQDDSFNLDTEIFFKMKDGSNINIQKVRLFSLTKRNFNKNSIFMSKDQILNISQPIDINAMSENDPISEKIIELFKKDGLGNKIVLKHSEKIFKANPWDTPEDSIELIKGENLIWFDNVPSNLYFEGEEIQIEVCEYLEPNEYLLIINKKLDYFSQQIRALKNDCNESSLDKTKQMLNYINNFENYFKHISKDFDKTEHLKVTNRMGNMRKSLKKVANSLTISFKEKKNTDKIKQLNSYQQSGFLRNIDNNKNGKGLAKRGLSKATEFDKIARKEVMEMASHFDEIKSINDSDHITSFYSNITTLKGIKKICDISKNKKVFQNLSIFDIIKSFNIVGVACNAPIKNYTDPLLYRLSDIYPETYVSLSDIIKASENNDNQNPMMDPKTQKPITNAIPIFDDQRIHQFLMKYAPNILEYVAGVGMRRVLARVQHSHEALIQSGILKLCQMLNTARDETHIKLFHSLIETYEIASDNRFSYVNLSIDQQIESYKANPKLLKNQIFLGEIPVGKMTTVFIKMIENNQIDYIPKVTRELFCYEVHKDVNKIIKWNDDQKNFIETFLNDLLGIDHEAHDTPLPKIFETDDEPVFYDQYTINEEKIEEIFKVSYRALYIPFEPFYIKAVLEDDQFTSFKNLEEYNDENIQKLLGINYDLKEFKLFSIVQAFLYRKNDERFDFENGRMKIIDIGDYEEARKMVKDYVVECYQSRYEKALTAIKTKEKDALENELVEEMLTTEDIEVFKRGFTTGITRGHTTAKIKNISCSAFSKLRNRITDPSKIPLFNEKIYIIIFGKDEQGNIIWNNGNIYKGYKHLFKRITRKTNMDLWDTLDDESKKDSVHVYNNIENQNTFSGGSNSNGVGGSDEPSNELALFYKSLEEMIYKISNGEIDECKSNQVRCCE